jgi:hypothetical protein
LPPLIVTDPVYVPTVVWLNDTLIVQLAPAASDVPQVPPLLPLGRVNCGPPLTTIELIVKVGAPATLLSVSVCVVVALLSNTEPKSSVAGVTVGACQALPLSCVAPLIVNPAPVVTVAVPFETPTTVGSNSMPIVQLLPALSEKVALVGQVPPDRT